jgi:hypothetical protein
MSYVVLQLKTSSMGFTIASVTAYIFISRYQGDSAISSGVESVKLTPVLVSETQDSESANLHSVASSRHLPSPHPNIHFTEDGTSSPTTSTADLGVITDMVSGSYQHSAAAVSITQNRNKRAKKAGIAMYLRMCCPLK